jgi:hypothetical protein
VQWDPVWKYEEIELLRSQMSISLIKFEDLSKSSDLTPLFSHTKVLKIAVILMLDASLNGSIQKISQPETRKHNPLPTSKWQRSFANNADTAP